MSDPNSEKSIPEQTSPKPPSSYLAIASLVMVIAGFITMGLAWVLGLILGIAALCQIRYSSKPIKGKALAIVSITLSTSLLIAAALFIWQADKNAKQTNCYSGLDELAAVTLMYAKDHQDRLPQANAWCDAVLPYISNNRKKFRCPSVKKLACAYAFNQNLSGMKLDAIKEPKQTVLLFESDLGWNAVGNIENLPKKPRHNGGDSYGFADGNGQWVKREDAPKLIWRPGLATMGKASPEGENE